MGKDRDYEATPSPRFRYNQVGTHEWMPDIKISGRTCGRMSLPRNRIRTTPHISWKRMRIFMGLEWGNRLLMAYPRKWYRSSWIRRTIQRWVPICGAKKGQEQKITRGYDLS